MGSDPVESQVPKLFVRCHKDIISTGSIKLSVLSAGLADSPLLSFRWPGNFTSLSKVPSLTGWEKNNLPCEWEVFPRSTIKPTAAHSPLKRQGLCCTRRTPTCGTEFH